MASLPMVKSLLQAISNSLQLVGCDVVVTKFNNIHALSNTDVQLLWAERGRYL